MRKLSSPAALGFAPGDLRRLSHALGQAREARVFRRLQAVLLVAQGQGFPQAAHAIGLDRRTVYRCVARYLARHLTADLKDRPRPGRPAQAPGLTRGRILQALRRSPLRLGYRTNVWTVPALTLHLNERHHSCLSSRTVCRRMKQIGLVCKRPRYFYSEKDPHRAQKKAAIVRKLKGLPPKAVLLFEDETVLRLLPELRRAWSLRGTEARVPITGENAKRVLFSTLNPRTGHPIVACGPSLRQEHFQEFLRRLRRAYPGRQIWLLLDKASAHTAPRSQALAEALNIVLIWLPKQCSELNGMDQLWRGAQSNRFGQSPV